jgi:hypothetical protein
MADEFRDPRAATATVTEGPPDLIGGVELYRPFEIDGRLVALPNVIAGIPEYMTVARAEAEANDFRARLLDDLEETNPQVAFQTSTEIAFGFYAAVGTAVTETITGLEGFANHFISRHFDNTGAFVLDDRSYSRSQVYDRPLNERFKLFLPPMIEAQTDRPGVAGLSPSSEPWWSTFRRIQALAALKRHSVYEAVGRSGLAGEKELVQRFVDQEYRGAAKMMLDLFEFFVPGWISRERLAQLPPPPT